MGSHPAFPRILGRDEFTLNCFFSTRFPGLLPNKRHREECAYTSESGARIRVRAHLISRCIGCAAVPLSSVVMPRFLTVRLIMWNFVLIREFVSEFAKTVRARLNGASLKKWEPSGLQKLPGNKTYILPSQLAPTGTGRIGNIPRKLF